MSDNEIVYDNEIAPKLAELAGVCAKNGMSLVASVEFEPGITGSTVMLAKEVCLITHMTRLAAISNGNVDAFLFSLMKYARQHGHNSIVLQQLGVPCVPESAVRQ